MAKDVLKSLSQISEKYPRIFLKQDFNPCDWNDLSPIYSELISREITSVEELEKLLLNWSELQSSIMEASSRLYINMTCFTDDEDNAIDYSEFIENISPRLAPAEDELNKKIAQLSYTKELSSYYQNWFLKLKNQIELFRDENVPIETKIALEVQKYQQVTGSMSIQHKGKDCTLQEVAMDLESPDRNLREQAWKAMAKRRYEDKDILNDSFDQLFSLRQEVSSNCGFPNFIEYIFKEKERFDYAPKDCFEFHKAVEELVVPLYRASLETRRKKLGLEKLRPWDLSCDIENKASLTPFKTIEELVEKTTLIFDKIDPQLSSWFKDMQERNLLDLDSRLGKAPGGYQCSLDENRLPFIFMNAVGTNSDVFTLLHEAGHSFHQYLMADQKIIDYRDMPSEIAEVASMSMERIGASYLEEFYTKEEADRARKDELEEVLRLLPWVATIDAFQHWMYSNPKHTLSERIAYWNELQKRFGPEVDWSGLEEYNDYSWQKQLHLFEVPFYYIEYGIAQLGALGVWNNWMKDPEKAMSMYKSGLSLGGSRSLPELFESTGIPFQFDKKAISPLIDLIQDQLSKIEGSI